jgi:NAD(P)-dependent dehydrogenase (short-subunit alcohol dehydrogenase family)
VAVVADASVDSAGAKVESAAPPVGALVKNAGITSPLRSSMSPARSGTGSSCERARDLQRPPACCALAERGFGRIAFLSSSSAERGGGLLGGVAYSAAKTSSKWPGRRPASTHSVQIGLANLWQISGKRRFLASEHETGRVLDPA